jgi:hypothetical protein
VRPFMSAIGKADIAALDRLAAEHPEVLATHEHDDRLTRAALGRGVGPFRGISTAAIQWLRSRAVNVQPALNGMLRGFLGGHMDPRLVRALLDHGADPAWVAPNGYPVLEHAMYRYWNGEAVDLIASRVKPRDNFWVAAGLGDAKRLRKYFGRGGKLTSAARRDRPDLMALSGHTDFDLPDPGDDMILWEAAFVAAVNGRAATFDILLENGFDIDMSVGAPLLNFAVGNGLLPMVELLVSRGASPHIHGWRPNQTALEMCVFYLGQRLDDPAMRRIVELLGGDPEAVAREADARRGPPKPIPGLTRILDFARQDAVRGGQSAVGLENFFVGLLASKWSAWELVKMSEVGVDLERLRAHFAGRLEAQSSDVSAASLPFDAELQAAMDAATADAGRKRDGIVPTAVFRAALEAESLVRVIREFGGDVRKLSAAIEALGT